MAKVTPHIKRTKAKGRVYYYFDTGQYGDDGKRIWTRLPDPSDRTFSATYAAMLGHRARRSNVEQRLSLAGMIALYQASDKFTKMADSTQRLYRLYQGELVDKLGTGPAQLIERKDIVLLLDKMADRPGAANMVQRAGSAAYTWARRRGHVTNDPFADIEPMKNGEHEPWPDEALKLALNSDDDLVRLTVHLLYYTAQRIGDVASMQWQDIQDGYITIRQRKTGKDLILPVHRELEAELARHPRSLTTIIPGRPSEAKLNRLRLAMQSVCAAGGFDVVPHGLRKNAVNALLEAGCSTAETSAISGQSLRMVEHYAKGRAQKKLGQAAILKWERTK